MSFEHSLVLVDAHVHIHDCFALPRFLNSAYANFREVAARKGACNDFTGVLLLTETARANWFKRLSTFVDNGPGSESIPMGEWRLHHTAENYSLLAERGQDKRLFIIAGRQIVTKENLEVLGLAIDSDFKDGAPLLDVLRRIRENGGIPVIPWGVGKWFGARGKTLRALLVNDRKPRFFLGDNGGRPVFWPEPPFFRIAKKYGIKVLRGTDPLPLASEAARPGSFGFIIPGAVSKSYPANDIKQLIDNDAIDIRSYGNLERSLRFFRNQLAIKIR